MLLLFRRRQISGVWKTEENGAKKGHAKQEAKPSLLALMSCPAVLYPSIPVLRPPLAVASYSGKLAIPHYHIFLLLKIIFDPHFLKSCPPGASKMWRGLRCYLW